MSRVIRAALVVGASALTTWALTRYSIRFEVLNLDAEEAPEDDGPSIVYEGVADAHESTPAARAEVLARIQARAGDFHAMEPTPGKSRFQTATIAGDLEGIGSAVAVALFFTESDPHALGVRVTVDEETEGFFVTSREDLLGALAGEEPTPGFVVIVRDEEDEGELNFFVQTSHGYRRLQVDADLIETFLAATNSLTPLGSERVDWEKAAPHLGLDPSQLLQEDPDE